MQKNRLQSIINDCSHNLLHINVYRAKLRSRGQTTMHAHSHS